MIDPPVRPSFVSRVGSVCFGLVVHHDGRCWGSAFYQNVPITEPIRGRTPTKDQGATDYGPTILTTDHELRTTDQGLRTKDYGLL